MLSATAENCTASRLLEFNAVIRSSVVILHQLNEPLVAGKPREHRIATCPFSPCMAVRPPLQPRKSFGRDTPAESALFDRATVYTTHSALWFAVQWGLACVSALPAFECGWYSRAADELIAKCGDRGTCKFVTYSCTSTIKACGAEAPCRIRQCPSRPLQARRRVALAHPEPWLAMMKPLLLLLDRPHLAQ